MRSVQIHLRWLAVLSICLLAGCSFFICPQAASAEPTAISGFSFLENHPTLGNIGLYAPGSAFSDDGSLGAASVDLKISFVGYATPADKLTIEHPILMFADGDVIFQLSPATHLPSTLGPIPGGSIFADILDASTNIPGLNVSHFVGGEFAFTYQNAQILPGQTHGGLSGGLTLGSIASGSFTFRVPEPSSIAFSLIGLIGLASVCYRQRKATA